MVGPLAGREVFQVGAGDSLDEAESPDAREIALDPLGSDEPSKLEAVDTAVRHDHGPRPAQAYFGLAGTAGDFRGQPIGGPLELQLRLGPAALHGLPYRQRCQTQAHQEGSLGGKPHPVPLGKKEQPGECVHELHPLWVPRAFRGIPLSQRRENPTYEANRKKAP